MNGTGNQRLDVDRIAAQNHDLSIGNSHLFVEFFFLPYHVGQMLDISRTGQ
jgi:hypothetical protein